MQVKLRRAAHTVNGYTFPGSSVTGELVDVGSEHSKGRNPYAVVRWPTGAQYYFRVNSGWGEKPVKSFQIEPESLALVQELAKEKRLKVVPVDAPPLRQARRHEAAEVRADRTAEAWGSR